MEIKELGHHTPPIPKLPGDTAALCEHVAVLEDICTAEQQIAHGEGIEYRIAKQQVLARFGRKGVK